MALVVALLTLESPSRGPQPALPASVDGPTTLNLSTKLSAVAPERPAGSEADTVAAELVRDQLSGIPGMGGKVQVQDFEARRGSRRVPLRNVYLAVPGDSGGSSRGGILVVAPRDTPRGVAAGASSTAVMLQLARLSAASRHLRPHLFVSTDGSTVGNAGIRWFLTRFSAFPIAAVVVLDGVGDAEGDRVHVWSRGATNAQALHLARIAEASIGRAGGRAEAIPGLGNQLVRLAVPQTSGEQGAAIAAGIPAVTLAGREDSPLRAGPAPSAARLALAASAAQDLLTVLDQPDAVDPPDTRIALAGREVRPTVVRLALLLLTLPLLVMAIDVVARARRTRTRLGVGLRAVARRGAPLAAAVGSGYLLVLFGVWPATAAGAPPPPADVGFGLTGILGLLVVAVVFFAVRRLVGPPPPAAVEGEVDPAQGAAGLVVLAVALLGLWLLSPFALLLALPAAHLLLLATAAERVWQVVTLAVLGLLPLLLLVRSIGSAIDSDLLFGLWYLGETTVAGGRGLLGPVFTVVIAAALATLAVHARERAREITSPGGARRRRRPRLRLQIERVPVGRRR